MVSEALTVSIKSFDGGGFCLTTYVPVLRLPETEP